MRMRAPFKKSPENCHQPIFKHCHHESNFKDKPTWNLTPWHRFFSLWSTTSKTKYVYRLWSKPNIRTRYQWNKLQAPRDSLISVPLQVPPCNRSLSRCKVSSGSLRFVLRHRKIAQSPYIQSTTLQRLSSATASVPQRSLREKYWYTKIKGNKNRKTKDR